MKTIRVVLVGSAVSVGRRCATFSSAYSVDEVMDMVRIEDPDSWNWRTRDEFDRVSMAALVDVTIDTLEPTDDGDPDELALCEQAQREDRT